MIGTTTGKLLGSDRNVSVASGLGHGIGRTTITGRLNRSRPGDTTNRLETGQRGGSARTAGIGIGSGI